MNKKIYTILIVVLCFVAVGCSSTSKSTYNNERNSEDYKKINNVNGMKFEVPKSYLEDAKSMEDIVSLDAAKTDETYCIDTLSNGYSLFNYEHFFVFASSDLAGINLEDVDVTDDLQSILEESGNDEYELGKTFVKSEEDGVIKIIADSTASIELSDDLSDDFVGKIALVQEKNRCSLLFIGAIEDSEDKDTNKIINYVSKSLVSDDYDDTLATSDETVNDTGAEADTEAEVTDDAQATSDSIATLSDDLYSFQVKIDGDIYQFPMTYDEFTAYGWKYDGDDTATMEPDQYSIAEEFKKDGLSIYTSIINVGINVEPFSNCVIGGINMDEFLAHNQNVSITLPGGIEYGVSTMDEVIAAYGKATDTYKGDLYTELTYTYDSYQEISIQISTKTKVVSAIDIRNFTAPEDTEQDSQISTDTPEIVKEYQEPSSLGNDLMEFVVNYDGDLYKLPAPVSEFEQNGWKIITDDSDSNVIAAGSGWVTLMKNNQKLSLLADNYADNATAITNCFITNIKASEASTNVPMAVQKGIEIGMSVKDLEKALSGVEYVKDDEDSQVFINYEIQGSDSSLDYVKITVSTETSKVEGIEESYSPDIENLYK